MLNVGNYRGRITGWSFGESSKKGTPYFEILARLTHREQTDDDGHAVTDKDGKPVLEELERPTTRSVQFWLSPKAIEMTAASLRSLGYTDKSLARLDPGHKEAFDLEGVEVVVNVKHEDYQGKPQERTELVRRSRRIAAAELENASYAALFAAQQERVAAAESGEKADDGM